MILKVDLAMLLSSFKKLNPLKSLQVMVDIYVIHYLLCKLTALLTNTKQLDFRQYNHNDEISQIYNDGLVFLSLLCTLVTLILTKQ